MEKALNMIGLLSNPELAAQADADAALGRALDEAMRDLDAAEVNGRPAALSLAFAEVARCHRAMDLLGPAEWYLQQALGWARTLGAVDSSVDLLCEMADLAAARAAQLDEDDIAGRHALLERARDHAYEAAEMAPHSADPHWEVNVLIRLSETLNACGDHDDALALQCRAMHRIVQTCTGCSLEGLPTARPRSARRDG